VPKVVDEACVREEIEHLARLTMRGIELVQINRDHPDVVEEIGAIAQHRQLGAFDVDLQQIDSLLEPSSQATRWNPRPPAVDRRVERCDGA